PSSDSPTAPRRWQRSRKKGGAMASANIGTIRGLERNSCRESEDTKTERPVTSRDAFVSSCEMSLETCRRKPPGAFAPGDARSLGAVGIGVGLRAGLDAGSGLARRRARIDLRSGAGACLGFGRLVGRARGGVGGLARPV